MSNAASSVMVLIAFLVTGCAGQPIFEDRSDQVTLKHRTPSK